MEFLVHLPLPHGLLHPSLIKHSLLRLLLGIVIAGMWPGMAYYLTLFYPPSRTGKRIGMYFTAAQVSAAVVGLVSAGFQKMDGDGGLVGFQWMFLLYGLVAVVFGFALLWWLPERPLRPGQVYPKSHFAKWLPRSPPALTGEDARIHYEDLTRVYHNPRWTANDLGRVFLDWRLYPLLFMYFGVVGVGIGVQNYATVIIKATNSKLTGVELSLLSAPIWIVRPFPLSLFSFPIPSLSLPSPLPSLPLLVNAPLLEESSAKSESVRPHRHPPHHPPLRPLPPPPRPLLLPPRAHPNRRPPHDYLRRHPLQPVAPLRRPPPRRFRPRSHRPHNHDLDERDLPAPPWRTRRCGRFSSGVRVGQLREYFDYLCTV